MDLPSAPPATWTSYGPCHGFPLDANEDHHGHGLIWKHLEIRSTYCRLKLQPIHIDLLIRN